MDSMVDFMRETVCDYFPGKYCVWQPKQGGYSMEYIDAKYIYRTYVTKEKNADKEYYEFYFSLVNTDELNHHFVKKNYDLTDTSEVIRTSMQKAIQVILNLENKWW